VNRTWYAEWPYFGECFQNTVLIWIASGWLWTTAPFYLRYLCTLKHVEGSWSWLAYSKVVWICIIDYSLIITSWHFMIEGGESSRYPQDFTSISMENLNYIFIIWNKPVIYRRIIINNSQVVIQHFNFTQSRRKMYAIFVDLCRKWPFLSAFKEDPAKTWKNV
jgi:hypothetical protein